MMDVPAVTKGKGILSRLGMASALVLALSSAHLARAVNADTAVAESTVREILARTLSRVLTVKEKAGDDQRFLTPSLYALFTSNARDFNADPYTGSQEPESYRLVGLSSGAQENGKIVVTAIFEIEGLPDARPRIAYVLVQGANGLRIDDIRYLNNDGRSMRQILIGKTPSPRAATPESGQAEAVPKPLRLDTPARFAEYPTKPIFRGPAAPVVLESAEMRLFRTRLRATVAEPVAFAGEYAVSLWSCGGGCVQGAVVSKRTGAVTFLPGSASGWGSVPEGFRPFMYRPDSNLLVVFGQVNEEGPVAATFYRFVNGTFIKFKIVPVLPDMPGYNAYVARL